MKSEPLCISKPIGGIEPETVSKPIYKSEPNKQKKGKNNE